MAHSGLIFIAFLLQPNGIYYQNHDTVPSSINMMQTQYEKIVYKMICCDTSSHFPKSCMTSLHFSSFGLLQEVTGLSF